MREVSGSPKPPNTKRRQPPPRASNSGKSKIVKGLKVPSSLSSISVGGGLDV